MVLTEIEKKQTDVDDDIVIVEHNEQSRSSE